MKTKKMKTNTRTNRIKKTNKIEKMMKKIKKTNKTKKTKKTNKIEKKMHRADAGCEKRFRQRSISKNIYTHTHVHTCRHNIYIYIWREKEWEKVTRLEFTNRNKDMCSRREARETRRRRQGPPKKGGSTWPVTYIHRHIYTETSMTASA